MNIIYKYNGTGQVLFAQVPCSTSPVMLCPQGVWFELQHHQFNRPSQKYMSWLTQEKRWPTQSKRMANARTQMVIFTFHLCWRCIGLWPGWSQVPAKVRQCPLVTARGTLAHEKLLGHLSYISSLPDESTLQLPSLCLHHRAGNIIEKMTELTGSLTGHYAFSRPRGSEENIECLCRSYATPDFRSLTRFPQTLVRNSKGPLAEPVRKGFFFLACTDETKSKIDDIVSGLRAFLQGGGLDCFWVGIGAASQVVPWQVGLVPVFGAWLH